MTTPPRAASQPTPHTLPTDAVLIEAARRGDDRALAEVIARHRAAARNLATSLVPVGGPDALLTDAIATVTAALRSGGGPMVCFRTYLLTTIRRRNHALATTAGRLRPID